MNTEKEECMEEESSFPYFIDYASYLSASRLYIQLVGHENWLEIMENKETDKIKVLDLGSTLVLFRILQDQRYACQII